MPEVTRNAVEKALAESLAARQATIAARKMRDPKGRSQLNKSPPLPGPANPTQIAGAEHSFGVTLPPSLKHLWSLHDGVPELDLASDLFGTGMFTEYNRGPAEKHLSKALKKIKRTSTNGLFVVGAQKSNKALFIFDSNKVDESGEWSVIVYDTNEGLIDEYENFVDFLDDTADTLRLMAKTYRR
jgi:hypothetical protein